MDITVYLPDEIGERAKKYGLNLSRMLRASVEEELNQLAELADTLSGMEEVVKKRQGRIVTRVRDPRLRAALGDTVVGPVCNLLGITDGGEEVLRGKHSEREQEEVFVFRKSHDEWVEYRCDRCGQFAHHVGPLLGGGRATCFDSDDDSACAEQLALESQGADA